MRVNIGSAPQAISGTKRGQKRKWDKNPPKNKGISVEKPKNVTKVKCFNYEELGHFAKDYEKVRIRCKGGLLQRQVWPSWAPI